ncbi:hypothetical protein D6C84_04565 [Aureobasidium pullulans]|uniref:Inhibitor I9 domain-containing protein n=1 Tax=Aureobasidium pullulans TaxID=5580 RepID=A0A4S9F760_AURPU|nr:hypothetical protein D6D10_01100 [Aureobasidium pullulans]THX70224.1 hypothetical protein D6D05_08709 [Aureobasidium pullulans]THX86027.1 hypothetical protein D6D04_01584 [Aureobasidium pullulans]THY10939.1 hypothetical protein D6D01_09104 [Aureobasidium pullulans]THY66607.1 hypothetical protein D6C97_01511 [Aureobasidium pullulans]
MKFTIHLLLIALLVALAYAATEQKQVIVSYPKDTPYSVIEHAMDAIKEAGGVITHEYKTLIKGFAATAPTKVVQSVKALGEKYNAIVEEDQVVSIVGTSS